MFILIFPVTLRFRRVFLPFLIFSRRYEQERERARDNPPPRISNWWTPRSVWRGTHPFTAPQKFLGLRIPRSNLSEFDEKWDIGPALRNFLETLRGIFNQRFRKPDRKTRSCDRRYFAAHSEFISAVRCSLLSQLLWFFDCSDIWIWLGTIVN